MAAIKVRDLRDDLPYGAIIEGVNFETVKDPAVRAKINDVFERRGMIVFTGCDPSAQLQVEVSKVFGPLKDHPTKTTARADQVDKDSAPGVIDMHYRPSTDGSDLGLVEVGGRKLAKWSNWHFDHCYNDELNLAGVLRSVIAAPEGGMTGFADGIQMYNDLSPELREKISKYNVVYTLDVRRSKMRFGRPKGFRDFGDNEYTLNNVREGLTFPRAMHPAVWTRPSGEKVLHVSPWMAVGLEHNETPEGDELLEAVCQEMIAKAKPYWHKWELDHMVIWDNRRMLHAVSGCDPMYERRMQRTTIRGDYGLGYFEDGKKIGEVQREFVA
jgi:taurine dioxygenase